jgi:hypothetical protein
VIEEVTEKARQESFGGPLIVDLTHIPGAVTDYMDLVETPEWRSAMWRKLSELTIQALHAKEEAERLRVKAEDIEAERELAKRMGTTPPRRRKEPGTLRRLAAGLERVSERFTTDADELKEVLTA